MLRRPRRNRRSPSIRSLIAETVLRPEDLVVPFFVVPGDKRKEELNSLPGVFQQSKDILLREAEKLHSQGIQAIGLFPVIQPNEKDPFGKEALNPKGIIPEVLKLLKKELPSLTLITDVALDPYTSHGHDGVLDPNGDVHNDSSVEILSSVSLLHAECGADLVAPSDMMDGRVAAIRKKLDLNNKQDVGILSYTAKYASSLYAPFRDILGSALKKGDKKTYQLNPSNVREALLEASLDEQEGADILMVKPALFYLDVLSKIRETTPLPLCAFHVSGEYAMVMAAAEKGYLDADKVFFESLMSIKRAGADFIYSYAAPRVLPFIR